MTFLCGLGLIFAWFTIKWIYRVIFLILAVKTAQKGMEVKKDGKV